MQKPGPELELAVSEIRNAAVAAGRDPLDIGIDGRVDVGDGNVARVVDEVAGWRAIGASHVSFGTMNAGLDGVDQHIAALRTALESVGD
jgi:hypothetical protein